MNAHRLIAACALALALTACASAPTPAPVAEDLAPFPYSAEAIRDASPEGRVYVFRLAQGEQVVFRTVRFAEVDAEGAAMVATLTDLTGAAAAPPTRERATWTELQAHASYPRASTTVTDATVTVPAGTFACRRYTVESADGDQLVVDFAVDLPGAPVSLVNTRGGVEVLRMTLERHERPGR